MVRKVMRWHCQRNHDHRTKKEAEVCENGNDQEPKFKKGDQFVEASALLLCLSFRRSRSYGQKEIDQRPKDPRLVPIYTVVKSEQITIDFDYPGYRVLGIKYFLVSDFGENITRSQTKLSTEYLQLGSGQKEPNRKSLYLRSHIVSLDQQYARVCGEIEWVVKIIHKRAA